MKRRSMVCFLFLFAASAWAQMSVNIKPGAINYAEGQVYLGEEPMQFSYGISHAVKDNQYLRTETGKAEVQLGLPATLWLGEKGKLRMEDSNPTNIQLFVDHGSIFVEVIERFDHQRIAIHFGDADVELREIGFYRFDSNPPRMFVYDGLAEILQRHMKAKVKPGRSADLALQLKVSRFDTEQNDPLRVWATQRSDVLYGRIKQMRNDELMWQQLMNRMQDQQIKDRIQQESNRRIIYQALESARILSQQQSPPH